LAFTWGNRKNELKRRKREEVEKERNKERKGRTEIHLLVVL
jgi:hypothetical protein